MLINYKFVTGETSGIETTEEWGAVVLDLDRLEYNGDQRETRRHSSLDAFNLDDAYFPSDVDIEEDVIRKESYEKLEAAITRLLPEQQRLIRSIYFEGIPAVEIVRQEGVLKTATSNRLSRALKNLKKYLE